MRPLQFDNSDFDALRHAKHKLQQFDEILAKEVNKPFLAEHHSIFGLLIGILTVSIIIIIICCCCCDCTWIPYFVKFFPSKSGSLRVGFTLNFQIRVVWVAIFEMKQPALQFAYFYLKCLGTCQNQPEA
jgi:hypothetical protein